MGGAGRPDRREREVKITPLDIRRKEFKRSVRGYSDEEVDIFLDEVADEFERLFQENMELHDRMQRMDEQIAGHAQLKDALEKTLVSAQLQAEELRANAHKESELILRDAEMKARGVVSDSYGETQKTQQTLVQLKLLEEDFRFKFRSLLEGYLRLLSQAPLAAVGSDAPLVAAVPPGAAPASGAVPAPPAASVPTPPTAPSPAPVIAQTPAAAAPQAPMPSAAPATVPARPAVPEGQQMPPRVMPPIGDAVYSPPAARPDKTPPPPPARPVVPAPLPGQAPLGSVPPRRPIEAGRPTVPVPDDDIPTQESLAGAVDVGGASRPYAGRNASEPSGEPTSEPTVEAPFEAETADTAFAHDPATADRLASEEPLRRFFFGRKLNDDDDTFQAEDTTNRDRNRDFEW